MSGGLCISLYLTPHISYSTTGVYFPHLDAAFLIEVVLSKQSKGVRICAQMRKHPLALTWAMSLTPVHWFMKEMAQVTMLFD